MNACLASTPATDSASNIEQKFLDFISAADYPCVGAKTAASRGGIQFAAAQDLRANLCDRKIARALQGFAVATTRQAMFVSMVVTFEGTPLLSEVEFENALWSRLQAIHEIDAHDHPWDNSVSRDPASPDFALSIGGRAFFIIGLHPGASREARRFACPALVFNLHSQFEQLRKESRFRRISGIIAKRDQTFSGSVNPMLAEHGASSDAPQYRGRQVDADWRCPFKATEAIHDSANCPAQRHRV